MNVLLSASKTDEGIISLSQGVVDTDTGEIVYSVITDPTAANRLDQRLQFAIGIDIEDIIENGAVTPYIDILLRSFSSIKIELVK